MQISLLPIATLRALSIEDQDQLARDSATVEKKAKDATTAHKASFPAVGKIVCILEERLNDAKTAKHVASNTSLATFWESITKSKINNHAQSCAVAFGAFVRTDLIEESDYDKNTAQCLELAASICTAVGGDTMHEAMAKAADELKDRSKDSAKNLKAILDDVKEPKFLTQEQAAKLLARIYQSNLLVYVIASTGAEIAHLEDPGLAKTAFRTLVTAMDMFTVNMVGKERRFSTELINSWSSELTKPANLESTGLQSTGLAETPAPAAPAPDAPAAAVAPETAPVEPPASKRKGRKSQDVEPPVTSDTPAEAVAA